MQVAVAGSTMELGRLNSYAMEFSRARSAAATLFHLMDRETEIDAYDPSGEKPVRINGLKILIY